MIDKIIEGVVFLGAFAIVYSMWKNFAQPTKTAVETDVKSEIGAVKSKVSNIAKKKL